MEESPHSLRSEQYCASAPLRTFLLYREFLLASFTPVIAHRAVTLLVGGSRCGAPFQFSLGVIAADLAAQPLDCAGFPRVWVAGLLSVLCSVDEERHSMHPRPSVNPSRLVVSCRGTRERVERASPFPFPRDWAVSSWQ